MKGVEIRKIKLVHEDGRRGIWEIMNGELSIKNMKILKVKKGKQLLGNHWHPCAQEVMYILKGGCSKYVMENIDTGEKETFKLTEGDVVFRTNRIVHGGIFDEDSIIIDGSTEVYINTDFNDIFKEVIKDEQSKGT